MARISAFRRAFTVLEVSVVIGIIAIIAIPVSALIINYSRAYINEGNIIKEQYYLNATMQDIEQRLRRANDGSVSTGSNTLSFSYSDSNKDGGNTGNTISITYNLVNAGTSSALMQRTINGVTEVFPTGLEPGIIRGFTASLSGSAPYYVTISLDSLSNIVLEKQIYLVNYSR